jgi:putative glutamine amidotransferase
MTIQPLIGFTLDYEATNMGYSKYPWYAIRENYLTSVSAAGGVPLPLPHELGGVETYLGLIQGLVVTGGAFDVSPAYYGQEIQSDTVSLKERRTQFEMAMIKGALKRNLPVLGICGGEQLLAVVLGATLIQHIPDVIANPLPHEQPNPRHEAGHSVTITAGTLLHRIIGKEEILVNSAHHQAVDNIGAGLIVNATSPDGVIEGIEHTGYRFCLGVQWHPEFHITPADTAIFQAFIAACSS